MVKVFEDLFTGTGLTVGVLFLFLAVYFIQDVVKKLNKAEKIESVTDKKIEASEKDLSEKIDNLEKKMNEKFGEVGQSLTRVTEKLHSINNSIQLEILRRENQGKAIETLTMDTKDHSHRIMSIEGALQLKPIGRRPEEH